MFVTIQIQIINNVSLGVRLLRTRHEHEDLPILMIQIPWNFMAIKSLIWIKSYICESNRLFCYRKINFQRKLTLKYSNLPPYNIAYILYSLYNIGCHKPRASYNLVVFPPTLSQILVSAPILVYSILVYGSKVNLYLWMNLKTINRLD